MESLNQFYLEPATMSGIHRFCQQEYRTIQLSRVIYSTMTKIFSKQTLAQLDKRYLAKGYDVSIQIDEVSKMAVYELLDREIISILDKQLLNDAWKKVYSAGLCPTNINVSH